MVSCGSAPEKARITESPRASEVMKFGSAPAWSGGASVERAITRAAGRRMVGMPVCAITAHHRRSPPLTARARMSYRPRGWWFPRGAPGGRPAWEAPHGAQGHRASGRSREVSELLAPLFRPVLAALFDDRARLQGILDFEAALARAHARTGICSAQAADRIARFCKAELLDPATLAEETARAG